MAANTRTRAKFYEMAEKFFQETETAAGKPLSDECVEWALHRYADNVWSNLPLLKGGPLNLTLQCCRTVGTNAGAHSAKKNKEVSKHAFAKACRDQEKTMKKNGLICA